MITSRMRASKVGLANRSSTSCVQPPKTLGELAITRNTLRLPRRAAPWRMGSGNWSSSASGMRVIEFLLSLRGQGEGPVQRHERLVDLCSVGSGAGLVLHEVGLQRGLIGEHGVAADVRIVLQEQLRDQRVIAVGVEPEVHVLGPHDGS